jgi:hypothetical protein
MIMRQMNGRTGFDLLWYRILLPTRGWSVATDYGTEPVSQTTRRDQPRGTYCQATCICGSIQNDLLARPERIGCPVAGRLDRAEDRDA